MRKGEEDDKKIKGSWSRLKIVTVKELSELLKVKEKTLYQWANLGQIPCIKLNRALRFDLDDIMAWVESCKKQPTSMYNPLTQARSPRKGGKIVNGALPKR